jgi:hypothetical protein
MRRSVYRELTSALLEDCRGAIAEFVASHHNQEVFAFALDCDPFHGDVMVGINTEPGFQKVLRDRYPKATRDEVEGLHGIRYRCADFAFSDFGLSEESLQLLDEIAAAQHDAKTDRTAERHADTLMLTLARVVLMLEPELATLHQTPEFVAYVTEKQASEASRVALIRRTVPEETFDKIFPEVRAFNDKLERILCLPPNKRAAFWAQSACDLACDHDSQDARRFQAMGMSLDRMLETVVELGSVAVPHLIDALQESAGQPQLAKPKSKAAREPAAHTASCAFSLQSIEAIRSIRLVDEDSVGRIRDLLQNIQSGKSKRPGPVALELAKLLHDLRPNAFPAPKSKGFTLVNASEFDAKPA